MRKEEIASNKQFFLFSQCFLPYMALTVHFKRTLNSTSDLRSGDCRFDIQLPQTFSLAYFSPLTSDAFERKVVSDFGNNSVSVLE